jgi:hypothetical protein
MRVARAERPPVTSLRQRDTHRLIPSKYLVDEDSVLTRLTRDEGALGVLFDLEQATNDRALAENGRDLAIGPAELVFGVRYHRMVNAAFVHPHPEGARFSSPTRGAWYAGFDVKTSQAEVAWHKSIELAEVGWFDQSLTYDDLLADFTADFHDLRGRPDFADCLAPTDYRAGQTLAELLLAEGSAGVIYPSVRRPAGTCLAAFRPALVYNVRRVATYRFTWSGGRTPTVRLQERRL